MVPHPQVKNPASSDAGASSLTSTSTDATAAASTTANDAHLILSAAASAVTGKQPPMTATREPLKPSHRRQVRRAGTNSSHPSGALYPSKPLLGHPP